MAGFLHARISAAPLDVGAATAAVSAPGNGALALFVGAIRNSNRGRPVTGVTFDVFADLARVTLLEIAGTASRGGEVDIWVEHREGRVAVGETAIVIAAASPHRALAFDACREVIEEVKRRAPIWKREHYADDGADGEWLAGTPLAAETPRDDRG